MSEPETEPHLPAEAPSRRSGQPVPWLVAVLLIVVIGVAASPFWAPTVTRLLPWGEPAASDPALAARLAQLEAARAEDAKTIAALRPLAERVAGLEAKPAPPSPDLAPMQQQLAGLSKAVAELTASVAALEKAAQARPSVDPGNAALALVLLQIREAVDVARPFQPEYQALLALAHDHPDIAAAAAPLERPAQTGVASRAALAARLHQLAPQIATATPPDNPGWWSEIRAQLRSLVTIRRVGGAAQTPEEAAVSEAERAVHSGDLAGAIAALEPLTGAHKAAAEPWLRMARNRVAVEMALRRIEALVTAQIGGGRAPAATGAPG